MPVSDVLKGFRDKGYGAKEGDDEKESDAGPRMIKLTDDEAKSLSEYSKDPGMEIECKVMGRLNGSELSVSSVSAPGGMGDPENTMPDQNMMGRAMSSGQGGTPLMQSQTMPSPS